MSLLKAIGFGRAKPEVIKKEGDFEKGFKPGYDTREQFEGTYRVRCGDYKLYLETRPGEKGVVSLNVLAQFGAAVGRSKDGAGMILTGSADKQALEAFAEQCRADERFRVVEGPVLVQG